MEKKNIFIRTILIATALITCTHSMAQISVVQDVQKNLQELQGDTMPDPIIMKELLITPDGSNPVDYILNNVARKKKENQQNLQYKATTECFLYSYNMDLLPQVMTKTQNWLIKTALGIIGMRSIYNYVTSCKEAGFGVKVTQEVQGRSIQYSDEEVLFAPDDAPQKVTKQIIKHAKFSLFNTLYGDNLLYNEEKRHKFYDIEFIGSAEKEDGSLYYILKFWRHKGDEDLETETTLHIEDGSWGILRKEVKSTGTYSYIESTNVSGVLLPAKYVEDPSRSSLEELIKEIKEDIEKDEEKGKKASKRKRKFIDKIEKLAKSGRNEAPDMKISFNVTYH